MRRKSKFLLIWTILASLALYPQFQQLITGMGYTDANSFFADALLRVKWAALMIIPTSLIYAVSSRRSAAKRHSFGPGLGRKSICHQCKQPVEELIDNKCQYCGWIRCQCGACGCGVGRLA